MPIYEFSCRKCDAGFEELVGSHVGLAIEDVRCPQCGSKDIARNTSSSYSPIHRLKTPAERRKSEQSRGADLAARKAEFKRKRSAARESKNRSEGR